MSTLSTDNQKSWKTTTQERPAALEIVLLKCTYVLPWSQFLFAEGGDDKIHLAFTTHDVLIKGTRLGVLLIDFAAQRVPRLEQATRGVRFTEGTAPSIRDLSVVKIEPSHNQG